MQGRRGVTAPLTELLMVVVAFAMIFVVAAFVVSNVQGLAGSTHRLQVYGDARLYVDRDTGNMYAVMRLYADVKPSVVIEYLEVGSVRSVNVTILEVKQGEPYVEDGKLVLPVGSDVVVRFDFPEGSASQVKPTFWGIVEGRMVTEQGFLYKVELKIVETG